MGKFKVVSEYTPSGDQPQAIDTLASGIENGLRDQVLLGVTGSGKTCTTITSRRRISPRRTRISKRIPPSTTRSSACATAPPPPCLSGGT